MAKIILHIGLPKTATSTLQRSFFTSLHQKGMINYFGNSYHNILASNKNFSKYKTIFNSAIDEEKTNVISSEAFFNIRNRLSDRDFAYFIKRLQNLLEGHSITVLVVIRRQPEYLYSRYVQSYWNLQYSETQNTIQKYYKNILLPAHQRDKTRDPSEPPDPPLKYVDTLKRYEKAFGNVQVLFFEELLENEFSYYQKIATLLNITMTHQDIPNQRSNVKQSSEQGYISSPRNDAFNLRRVALLRPGYRKTILTKNYKCYKHVALTPICDYLPGILYRLFVRYNIFLSTSQKNQLKHKKDQLISFLYNLFFKPTLHPYFTEEQKQTILALCKETNQELAKENFCTMEDLKKYGYL